MGRFPVTSLERPLGSEIRKFLEVVEGAGRGRNQIPILQVGRKPGQTVEGDSYWRGKIPTPSSVCTDWLVEGGRALANPTISSKLDIAV